MFQIVVCSNYDEVSREAFRIVREVLKKEAPVLALAAGSSPIGLYKKMIADHTASGTSYKHVSVWSPEEYIGIPRGHDQSFWSFMHKNLFDSIDISDDNIHVPRGDSPDVEEECRKYDEAMKDVRIDLQVLGIGADGHIGFNEPGTSFDSLSHVVELTEQTRRDNSRFFDDDIDNVPETAITMGLATIMRAEKTIVLAVGENKAEAVYGMIKGEKNVLCPASVLRDHPDVTVILDQEAASRL